MLEVGQIFIETSNKLKECKKIRLREKVGYDWECIYEGSLSPTHHALDSEGNTERVFIVSEEELKENYKAFREAD